MEMETTSENGVAAVAAPKFFRVLKKNLRLKSPLVPFDSESLGESPGMLRGRALAARPTVCAATRVASSAPQRRRERDLTAACLRQISRRRQGTPGPAGP